MQITGDVLAEFATNKVADLLITGDASIIINALLEEELGGKIANIGDVVCVELRLQELAILASTAAADQIVIVQLNRNSKRDGQEKQIPTSEAPQAT